MERKVAALHALHQILSKYFLSYPCKWLVFSKNFANNFRRWVNPAPVLLFSFRCVISRCSGMRSVLYPAEPLIKIVLVLFQIVLYLRKHLRKLLRNE
jgi:hypothetical protein